MKLNEIVQTTPSEITDKSILSTDVIGLKIQDTINDIGTLERMSLSSFIADASPENARKSIEQLRLATSNIDNKQEDIRKLIEDIKSINQTEVNRFNFEKQSTRPMSLKTAIDAISSTYVTTATLQTIVNDVYSALWTAVNDMMTTGFQTSMYARQYTGAIQGISETKPSYAKIVLPDAEEPAE